VQHHLTEQQSGYPEHYLGNVQPETPILFPSPIAAWSLFQRCCCSKNRIGLQSELSPKSNFSAAFDLLVTDHALSTWAEVAPGTERGTGELTQSVRQ
jgi:hypothetical protein